MHYLSEIKDDFHVVSQLPCLLGHSVAQRQNLYVSNYYHGQSQDQALQLYVWIKNENVALLHVVRSAGQFFKSVQLQNGHWSDSSPYLGRGGGARMVRPPPLFISCLVISSLEKLRYCAFKVFKICYHSVFCIVFIYAICLNNSLLKLFP